MTGGADAAGQLDPRDREYVAGLEPELREAVVSTITRYQRPDQLGRGDPLPALDLVRPEDGSTVELVSLVDGRPLVLVFGSYT